VADLVEFAELFDVDMEEFAGRLALIATHRLGRIQRLQSVEAEAAENTADGRRGDTHLFGDV
jgi:hypothetical protein